MLTNFTIKNNRKTRGVQTGEKMDTLEWLETGQTIAELQLMHRFPNFETISPLFMG